MNFDKDYYDVLGVLPNAEDFLIRAAYKALTQRYHPDKFQGSKQDAEVKMKALNEAYPILSNTDKRKQYDTYLEKQGKKNEYHENDAKKTDAEELVNDEDWNIAVHYVPELRILYNNLSVVSPNLAFNFKLYILKDKAFDKAQRVANELEAKFFVTYFGDNSEIHKFAKFLLIQKHRDAAQELNKVIKLFANKVSIEKIIENVCLKYRVNYKEDDYFSKNAERKRVDKETRDILEQGLAGIAAVMISVCFIAIGAANGKVYLLAGGFIAVVIVASNILVRFNRKYAARELRAKWVLPYIK